MNWTEIEAKWAAMTRRVQSDPPLGDGNLAQTSTPEQAPLMQDEVSDLRAPTPLDRPST
jgi:hypothetical protein